MLPVTRRRPSPLKATLSTPLVCPRRVKISWPVSVSQSLTVRSKLAVASRRPSGLKSRETTFEVCPRSVKIRRPSTALKRRTSPGDRSIELLHAASHRPSGL